MTAAARRQPAQREDFAIGAYASAAIDLRERGLCPIPLGGPEHRTPVVRGFTKYRARPSVETIERLIARYPAASLGLVTAWRILVVDVDSADPVMLQHVEHRFGEAVIRIRTPRGGWHLYYRFAGERCRNLRREGLPADVKARGGFVVAPPSVRQSGENAGRAYTFERGSWDDLPRLEAIKPGSLAPRIAGASDRPVPAAAPRSSRPVVELAAVGIGHRNDMLFRSALICAPSCGSEAELLECGIAINAGFNPPLELAEVAKTIRSAWGYEQRGENRIGHSSGSTRPAVVRQLLAPHPRAEELYRLLRRWNGARDARGETFFASPAAMAKAERIPGWQPHHYRRALAVLVELGLLVIVHRGGRRPGDARQFRFGKGEPPMTPQLVVSNDDNEDFLIVVGLLKEGTSIRVIADAMRLSKSHVHRLKQRAVAEGLLGQAPPGAPSQPSNCVPASVTNIRLAPAPLAAAALGESGTDTLPSESGDSGGGGAVPDPLVENRAAARAPIVEPAAAACCMLNLPDGKGGYRPCNVPVGRSGIFCQEHE